MKYHLMIALGLLMGAVFSYRFANAILAPGFGLLEVYLLGGIGIAIWLIFAGLKERRFAKAQSKTTFRPKT
ncbi:MAG: hypothetical protein AAF603_00495 [Pseudomonadota bacterium]